MGCLEVMRRFFPGNAGQWTAMTPPTEILRQILCESVQEGQGKGLHALMAKGLLIVVRQTSCCGQGVGQGEKGGCQCWLKEARQDGPDACQQERKTSGSVAVLA